MLSLLRGLLNRGGGATREGVTRDLEAGFSALRDGDVTRAVRELENAVAAAPDDAALLQRCGVALAAAGRLVEAERYLRRALDVRPADPGVASDLANVLLAGGEAVAARRLYEQALAADADFAPGLINLGLLDVSQRAFDSALLRFKRVLAGEPGNVAAARHAGRAASALGDFADAEQLLRAALAAADDPDVAHDLVVALGAQGKNEEAIAVLEGSAARHPRHLATLQSLGLLALNRNEAVAAAGWLERAADLAPEDAGLQSNLGLAYARAGRYEDAVDALRLALHYDPSLVAAHVNLGVAHAEGKRWTEAAEAFGGALALAPDHPQAVAGLARALQQLYRLEEAEAQFKHALELAPASAELWTRLGQVYRDLGRYGEARAAFDRALEVDPGYLHALTHAGLVALDQRDPERAMKCFEGVVSSDLGLDDEALWNITCARLLCADWEHAWEFYEHRWKSPDVVRRPFDFPVWDGGDIAGRTLLVYAEQGLGDEIMFASCYHELQRRVGHLVIECSPKLEKLFLRSFPGASVVGRNQADAPDWLAAAPRIDVQAACGTVASYLRRTSASFPAHSGYLRADPQRIAYWRKRLATLGPGPKIGFSWRGGSSRTRTRLRSIALADWLPVLGIDGAAFVSVQYHPDAANELEAFHSARDVRVHHWAEAIDDYDETAALVCALDAIVSVCTAIIHLGGALGRPVRVVVPASPEWRYGLMGDRMPWYPTVRLFRQAHPGDWGDAIGRIRDTLTDEFRTLPVTASN